MKLNHSELHDEHIIEEPDGTFTASLEPWFDEPIKGIPTRNLAREFLHAAHEAMRHYADTAMSD